VRRIVFSSTAAVYGEPVAVPIHEGHPLSPINAYGESKLACERMIDWFCRAHDFKAVMFRYFNAAGATAARGEAHRHESHLIPIALKAATGDSPFPVYGTDYPTPDGTCIRDFVHVLDIADAHLSALARMDALGCTSLNLGPGEGQSVRQVLAAIARVVGREVPIEYCDRRPGDPAVLIADSSAARRQLGWTASRSSIDTIVESAWQWTLAHPNGYLD
jgi:UDP-glucose 4-epimerase